VARRRRRARRRQRRVAGAHGGGRVPAGAHGGGGPAEPPPGSAERGAAAALSPEFCLAGNRRRARRTLDRSRGADARALIAAVNRATPRQTLLRTPTDAGLSRADGDESARRPPSSSA